MCWRAAPELHTKQNACWDKNLRILHHGTIRCGTLQWNRYEEKLKRRLRVWNKNAPNTFLRPSQKTFAETDHELNRDRTDIRGNIAPTNCLPSHHAMRETFGATLY